MQNKIKKETVDKNFTKEYVLWHGSISGIDFPIRVNYSNNLCDFGVGFYLGELKEQAENRVSNYKNAMVYKMILKLDDKCRIYRFEDDILWAIYIAYNRKKYSFNQYPKLLKILKNIDKYDIIIGKIADDKVSNTYNNFIGRNYTDKVLIESLKLVKYGNQIVIKNQKYVNEKYLIIESSKKLSKNEKENSIKWGKELKNKMNIDLDEIVKKYRRDGKYIDEILEEYK